MIEKPSAGDQMLQHPRCLALDRIGRQVMPASVQNAVTLADVGATAIVANRNAPGCASSAKLALHAGPYSSRCRMLLRQYKCALSSSGCGGARHRRRRRSCRSKVCLVRFALESDQIAAALVPVAHEALTCVEGVPPTAGRPQRFEPGRQRRL